jgi:YVTN family beta-propeller protein
VTVIDGSNFSTLSIPMENPTYLAVDEVRNKIYVTCTFELIVIDGATNTTTSLGDLLTIGPIHVNSLTNKIYVITAFGVTVIDGSTYTTTNVPVGQYPVDLAINTVTNKIYVANQQGGSVTVIDGETNGTVTVPLAGGPALLAVNPYTNKIFAYCAFNGFVSVIDGVTLATANVTVGQSWRSESAFAIDVRTNKIYVGVGQDQYTSYLAIIDGSTLAVTDIQLGTRTPFRVAVEPITNKIYLTYENFYNNGLILFDGATNNASTLLTGNSPSLIAIDSVNDRIYVTDNNIYSVYVFAGPNALRFIPVTPCRVVDTRNPDGPFGGPTIQGGTYRIFPIPQGACNIPATAQAYSFNVTVVPQGYLGYLTVWPDGLGLPGVSTINSVDGRIKAGASISPAGAAGAVDAYASNTTDLILDINGYFERASSTALAFYPLTGCRVADTRAPDGPLGGPYLIAGQERDFPVLESACSIPSTAQAYSLNVTAYPHGRLGYLTVWPEGQPRPQSSTLNAINGLATANEAIVPAGVSGGVAVYPSADSDLTLDVNGYFATPGEGGMSFYALVPCRVLDTRQTRGAFTGTILTDVVNSGCGTQAALVYVMNATVVPQTGLNHLTIWPTTEQQPPVYTLEAWDGVITSNLAIVANIDGWLDAYASNSTQLILDSFGYFAP